MLIRSVPAPWVVRITAVCADHSSNRALHATDGIEDLSNVAILESHVACQDFLRELAWDAADSHQADLFDVAHKPPCHVNHIAGVVDAPAAQFL
jgi:hypothetical protein